MQIVITDGYTTNPGDLSWEPIRELGQLEIYERTPPELLTERCRLADIVLTNKVPLSAETMQHLPRLKLITVLATGYNLIDVEYARARSIPVCHVPGYGTPSVAQHTIALMLELTNQVGKHAASVAKGDWGRSPDWCYVLSPVTELAGKTLGIVGWGNIGQQVAYIALALGMRVLYYNPRKIETGLAEFADLEQLFATSDIISLHCPLRPENHQFVNKKLIGMMKGSAYLVNTARGQLIQEEDLADALNKSVIAGAALDVLSVEPPTAGNPLLSARNCIITPHNAWMSRESRQRILDATVEIIKAYLDGNPIHVVN